MQIDRQKLYKRKIDKRSIKDRQNINTSSHSELVMSTLTEIKLGLILEKWFNKQKDTGKARWVKIENISGTSKKGWDLVCKRKDVIHYIEVKCIKGEFMPYFSGFLGSLFADRKESKSKHKEKYERIGWAFNVTRPKHKNEKLDVLINFLDKIRDNAKLWQAILNHSQLFYFYLIGKDNKIYPLHEKKLPFIIEICNKNKDKNELRQQLLRELDKLAI